MCCLCDYVWHRRQRVEDELFSVYSFKLRLSQGSTVNTYKRMWEVMEQNKEEVLMEEVIDGVQKVSHPAWLCW